MRAPQQLAALQVERPEPLWTRGGGALRLLHGASGQQRGRGQCVQVRTAAGVYGKYGSFIGEICKARDNLLMVNGFKTVVLFLSTSPISDTLHQIHNGFNIKLQGMISGVPAVFLINICVPLPLQSGFRLSADGFYVADAPY